MAKPSPRLEHVLRVSHAAQPKAAGEDIGALPADVYEMIMSFAKDRAPIPGIMYVDNFREGVGGGRRLLQHGPVTVRERVTPGGQPAVNWLDNWRDHAEVARHVIESRMRFADLRAFFGMRVNVAVRAAVVLPAVPAGQAPNPNYDATSPQWQPVLLQSPNGAPTYIFNVSVQDGEMRITYFPQNRTDRFAIALARLLGQRQGGFSMCDIGVLTALALMRATAGEGQKTRVEQATRAANFFDWQDIAFNYGLSDFNRYRVTVENPRFMSPFRKNTAPSEDPSDRPLPSFWQRLRRG